MLLVAVLWTVWASVPPPLTVALESQPADLQSKVAAALQPELPAGARLVNGPSDLVVTARRTAEAITFEMARPDGSGRQTRTFVIDTNDEVTALRLGVQVIVARIARVQRWRASGPSPQPLAEAPMPTDRAPFIETRPAPGPILDRITATGPPTLSSESSATSTTPALARRLTPDRARYWPPRARLDVGRRRSTPPRAVAQTRLPSQNPPSPVHRAGALTASLPFDGGLNPAPFNSAWKPEPPIPSVLGGSAVAWPPTASVAANSNRRSA